MQKQGFTIIEVVVVFLLMLMVAFFILPTSLETTNQARFISMWSAKYSQLEYMFSVIKAQDGAKIDEMFDSSKNTNDQTKILLDIIKPYLRITQALNNADYHPHYMNKLHVNENDEYYFNKFYLTSSNEIIGIQKTNSNCSEKNICTVLSFDLNGTNPPNAWGYDIFGINVYKNRIEPVGKGLDMDTLRTNCSKNDFGIYCSYYYLIGGKFD